MKNKHYFTIVYSVLLTAFTLYGLLDVFVIPKVNAQVSFSFASRSSRKLPSSSSKSSSSSKASSIVSSSSKTSSSVDASSNDTSSISSVSSSNNSSTSSQFSLTPVEPEITFTEEVVLTDMLYSDPYTYVQVYEEKVQCYDTTRKKYRNTTVFWADVRLADIVDLRTALAKNQYGENINEKTTSMAKRNHAILAINGDYYGAQKSGYVVRNSIVYNSIGKPRPSNPKKEDLAIMNDGSFEIFNEKDVTLEQLTAANPWQVFCFGPVLVNNYEIMVTSKDEVDVYTKTGNQRTAIGIVEPLHYVFAVTNGRTEADYGMSLFEIAQFMKDKKCKIAYNLDGGGSSTFVFNDKMLNTPLESAQKKGERAVSDCVYINREQ